MGTATHIDTSDQSALALRSGLLKRDGRVFLVDLIHRGGERIGHVLQVPGAGGRTHWRWEIDAYEVVGEALSREGALRIAQHFLARQDAQATKAVVGSGKRGGE